MPQVGTASSDLWAHLATLSTTLGITIWPWEGMEGAIGIYSAPRPSTIHITNRLDDRARTMAVVHELGHASLHPPGRPNGPKLPMEEPAVHTAAADEVCTSYGVHDYRETLIWNGTTFEPVTADDPDGRALANRIVRRLTDALAYPDRDPGWVPHK
jgi:hypothetical protein